MTPIPISIGILTISGFLTLSRPPILLINQPPEMFSANFAINE